MIQSRAGRGESRARAADMLTEGYSAFTDRVAKENERLFEDNQELRKALSALINAVIRNEAEHPHVSEVTRDLLHTARLTAEAAIT